MAAGYDGTIRIDTSVDSKGFNAGIKKISSSLGSIVSKLLGGLTKAAVVIAAVLGVVLTIAAAVLGAAIAVGVFAQKFSEAFIKGATTTSAYYDQILEVKTAFDNLKGSVMALGGTLLTALSPLFNIVINWLIQAINYVSMFIAALAGQKSVMQYVAGSASKASNATKKAAKDAKGALAAFDELNVLEQKNEEDTSGGTATGGTGQYISVQIDPAIQEKVDQLKKFFTETIPEIFKQTIPNFFENLWAGIVYDAVTAWFNIEYGFRTAWSEITSAFSTAWSVIVGVWIGAGPWFKSSVIDPMVTFFSTAWTNIKLFFSNAWQWIVSVWKGAPGWFQTNIIDPLKNGFDIALDWIKAKWETIFTGIKDFVKTQINAIIGFINGMINGIVTGINAVISTLNSIHVSIPDWVPKYGGSSFGINLAKVSAVQIPYLATGAVIPANSEFLAVMGDQKSGTNIEAPADLIRDIVDDVVSSRLSGQQIQIGFKGSMSALVRAMKPYIDKENNRIGKSLITSGSAT